MTSIEEIDQKLHRVQCEVRVASERIRMLQEEEKRLVEQRERIMSSVPFFGVDIDVAQGANGLVLTDKSLQVRVVELFRMHQIPSKEWPSSIFYNVDNIRYVFNSYNIECPTWLRTHPVHGRHIRADKVDNRPEDTDDEQIEYQCDLYPY